MLFAILCTDKPDSAALRAATRPAHLDYLKSHADRLVLAGPILDADGTPRGSLLVVDLADRAAAEALAAGDPYVAAGLFRNTEINAYRAVFKDGQQA